MEKYSPMDKATFMERSERSCQAALIATHIVVNKSRSCLLKPKCGIRKGVEGWC